MYCTHNSNSAKRHDGQLVRKLFQPVEFSTVVQKGKNRILHQRTDFPISLTYIRLDTDASRLCVIRKIWSRLCPLQYNTVFPPAHSAEVLELMTATKSPQWTNLKKPLLPVTSRGQLGWPPPTKEDGPYQVARTGLHGKLEQIVLQVDRGAEATQDLPMHKDIMSATKQKNFAKNCPTWALNSYWVVQCYRGPRTSRFD